MLISVLTQDRSASFIADKTHSSGVSSLNLTRRSGNVIRYKVKKVTRIVLLFAFRRLLKSPRVHFAGVDHAGGPSSPQDEFVRLADMTGSGIELSSAIFSLINALFLRGLN
jgi:hypothetical protein